MRSSCPSLLMWQHVRSGEGCYSLDGSAVRNSGNAQEGGKKTVLFLAELSRLAAL